MVARSLISTGNNFRIKKAINKAKKGEEVTISYLGGSITLGTKKLKDRLYTISSFKYFKERFASGENVRYINAGMNGTSSIIGLIRLERDVLRYNPDIIFIDFSVNDSKDSLHREIFESLVVRLLESENKPAIILLFVQSEAGYTCQGHMQAIGEHYKLPMISVCDAIMPEIQAGRMLWSEYADDNIHPGIRGNDLMTEFISHYYETVVCQQDDEEETLPQEPFYGTLYKYMKLIDGCNLAPLTMEGFQNANTIVEFPNGWIRDSNSNISCFKFTLSFKNLFIIYKESNKHSEGSIIVTVDGVHAGIYSGYSIFGWDNPVAKLVYSNDIEKEHLVEITMSAEDKNKDFTLLAFGYC